MNYRKIAVTLLLAVFSVQANAVCTSLGKIEKIWPRSGGWVHVQLAGMSNMDINSCGAGGATGLLLNFNNSSGTSEGKQMLYSTLLAAFMAGKQLSLCSNQCDTQFPTYSVLTHIDNLQ